MDRSEDAVQQEYEKRKGEAAEFQKNVISNKSFEIPTYGTRQSQQFVLKNLFSKQGPICDQEYMAALIAFSSSDALWSLLPSLILEKKENEAEVNQSVLTDLIYFRLKQEQQHHFDMEKGWWETFKKEWEKIGDELEGRQKKILIMEVFLHKLHGEYTVRGDWWENIQRRCEDVKNGLLSVWDDVSHLVPSKSLRGKRLKEIVFALYNDRQTRGFLCSSNDSIHSTLAGVKWDDGSSCLNDIETKVLADFLLIQMKTHAEKHPLIDKVGLVIGKAIAIGKVIAPPKKSLINEKYRKNLVKMRFEERGVKVHALDCSKELKPGDYRVRSFSKTLDKKGEFRRCAYVPKGETQASIGIDAAKQWIQLLDPQKNSSEKLQQTMIHFLEQLRKEYGSTYQDYFWGGGKRGRLLVEHVFGFEKKNIAKLHMTESIDHFIKTLNEYQDTAVSSAEKLRDFLQGDTYGRYLQEKTMTWYRTEKYKNKGFPAPTAEFLSAKPAPQKPFSNDGGTFDVELSEDFKQDLESQRPVLERRRKLLGFLKDVNDAYKSKDKESYISAKEKIKALKVTLPEVVALGIKGYSTVYDVNNTGRFFGIFLRNTPMRSEEKIRDYKNNIRTALDKVNSSLLDIERQKIQGLISRRNTEVVLRECVEVFQQRMVSDDIAKFSHWDQLEEHPELVDALVSNKSQVSERLLSLYNDLVPAEKTSELKQVVVNMCVSALQEAVQSGDSEKVIALIKVYYREAEPVMFKNIFERYKQYVDRINAGLVALKHGEPIKSNKLVLEELDLTESGFRDFQSTHLQSSSKVAQTMYETSSESFVLFDFFNMIKKIESKGSERRYGHQNDVSDLQKICKRLNTVIACGFKHDEALLMICDRLFGYQTNFTNQANKIVGLFPVFKFRLPTVPLDQQQAFKQGFIQRAAPADLIAFFECLSPEEKGQYFDAIVNELPASEQAGFIMSDSVQDLILSDKTGQETKDLAIKYFKQLMDVESSDISESHNDTYFHLCVKKYGLHRVLNEEAYKTVVKGLSDGLKAHTIEMILTQWPHFITCKHFTDLSDGLSSDQLPQSERCVLSSRAINVSLCRELIAWYVAGVESEETRHAVSKFAKYIQPIADCVRYFDDCIEAAESGNVKKAAEAYDTWGKSIPNNSTMLRRQYDELMKVSSDESIPRIYLDILERRTSDSPVTQILQKLGSKQSLTEIRILQQALKSHLLGGPLPLNFQVRKALVDAFNDIDVTGDCSQQYFSKLGQKIKDMLRNPPDGDREAGFLDAFLTYVPYRDRYNGTDSPQSNMWLGEDGVCLKVFYHLVSGECQQSYHDMIDANSLMRDMIVSLVKELSVSDRYFRQMNAILCNHSNESSILKTQVEILVRDALSTVSLGDLCKYANGDLAQVKILAKEKMQDSSSKIKAELSYPRIQGRDINAIFAQYLHVEYLRGKNPIEVLIALCEEKGNVMLHERTMLYIGKVLRDENITLDKEVHLTLKPSDSGVVGDYEKLMDTYRGGLCDKLVALLQSQDGSESDITLTWRALSEVVRKEGATDFLSSDSFNQLLTELKNGQHPYRLVICKELMIKLALHINTLIGKSISSAEAEDLLPSSKFEQYRQYVQMMALEHIQNLDEEAPFKEYKVVRDALFQAGVSSDDFKAFIKDNDNDMYKRLSQEDETADTQWPMDMDGFGEGDYQVESAENGLEGATIEDKKADYVLGTILEDLNKLHKTLTGTQTLIGLSKSIDQAFSDERQHLGDIYAIGHRLRLLSYEITQQETASSTIQMSKDEAKQRVGQLKDKVVQQQFDAYVTAHKMKRLLKPYENQLKQGIGLLTAESEQDLSRYQHDFKTLESYYEATKGLGKIQFNNAGHSSAKLELSGFSTDNNTHFKSAVKGLAELVDTIGRDAFLKWCEPPADTAQELPANTAQSPLYSNILAAVQHFMALIIDLSKTIYMDSKSHYFGRGKWDNRKNYFLENFGFEFEGVANQSIDAVRKHVICFLKVVESDKAMSYIYDKDLLKHEKYKNETVCETLSLLKESLQEVSQKLSDEKKEVFQSARSVTHKRGTKVEARDLETLVDSAKAQVINPRERVVQAFRDLRAFYKEFSKNGNEAFFEDYFKRIDEGGASSERDLWYASLPRICGTILAYFEQQGTTSQYADMVGFLKALRDYSECLLTCPSEDSIPTLDDFNIHDGEMEDSCWVSTELMVLCGNHGVSDPTADGVKSSYQTLKAWKVFLDSTKDDFAALERRNLGRSGGEETVLERVRSSSIACPTRSSFSTFATVDSPKNMLSDEHSLSDIHNKLVNVFKECPKVNVMPGQSLNLEVYSKAQKDFLDFVSGELTKICPSISSQQAADVVKSHYQEYYDVASVLDASADDSAFMPSVPSHMSGLGVDKLYHPNDLLFTVQEQDDRQVLLIEIAQNEINECVREKFRGDCDALSQPMNYLEFTTYLDKVKVTFDGCFDGLSFTDAQKEAARTHLVSHLNLQLDSVLVEGVCIKLTDDLKLDVENLDAQFQFSQLNYVHMTKRPGGTDNIFAEEFQSKYDLRERRDGTHVEKMHYIAEMNKKYQTFSVMKNIWQVMPGSLSYRLKREIHPAEPINTYIKMMFDSVDALNTKGKEFTNKDLVEKVMDSYKQERASKLLELRNKKHLLKALKKRGESEIEELMFSSLLNKHIAVSDVRVIRAWSACLGRADNLALSQMDELSDKIVALRRIVKRFGLKNSQMNLLLIELMSLESFDAFEAQYAEVVSNFTSALEMRDEIRTSMESFVPSDICGQVGILKEGFMNGWSKEGLQGVLTNIEKLKKAFEILRSDSPDLMKSLHRLLASRSAFDFMDKLNQYTGTVEQQLADLDRARTQKTAALSSIEGHLESLSAGDCSYELEHIRQYFTLDDIEKLNLQLDTFVLQVQESGDETGGRELLDAYVDSIKQTMVKSTTFDQYNRALTYQARCAANHSTVFGAHNSYSTHGKKISCVRA